MKKSISIVVFSFMALVSVAKEEGNLHWVGTKPSITTPVTFGVPFSKGEIMDEKRINLETSKGGPLPCDTWPLAYWPDGSVKWAAVAAVVDPVQENVNFVIGKHASKPEKPLKVEKTNNQYIVITDRLKVFVSQSGRMLADSIVLDGHTTGTNLSLVCSTQDALASDGARRINIADYVGHVDHVEIEQQGNIRATLRLTGHYQSDTRTWLPFTVRLYIYSGCPEIKMVHSFIYDGDMNKDFIRSLGVQVNVPMRERVYNRHIAFATPEGCVWSEPVQPLVGRRILSVYGDKDWQQRQMRGERIPEYEEFDEKNQGYLDSWAAWDCFKLSQTTADAFTIRKNTGKGSSWIGTFAGGRAPGYAFAGDLSGGMGICLDDFWQSFPTGLEVSGARSECATLTAWFWSPDGEPMDLRHYDDRAHGLDASYEDVQEGMSVPVGIARTHTLTLMSSLGYKGKEDVATTARNLSSRPQLLCTPEYLHSKRAFGIWGLPNTSNELGTKVENRLNVYLDYYKHAQEEHRWYGFWNYGDFMHTYDAVRHEWKYDVGGYAWDNTELASNLWIWYSFLRTGRDDLWKMAVAMSRHTTECDVYHSGPFARLGSRHNVSHWGCGAKEARISQALWNRFLYYLTADERSGDLMTEVKDADQMLYDIDPMRLALPREKYPCTAPARLRVGPDWLAYACNWMTEWERTRDNTYRDKIIAGMKSMAVLPKGLATGPGVLGFDPATGILSYEGEPEIINRSHLLAMMGGFEFNNELMEMIDLPEWNDVWLQHTLNYKQKVFPVTRLTAYAAYKTGRADLKEQAWKALWNTTLPATVSLSGSEVASPRVENAGISTNGAATWSLCAIYMQEVIPQ